jgi:hypothetical protein
MQFGAPSIRLVEAAIVGSPMTGPFMDEIETGG